MPMYVKTAGAWVDVKPYVKENGVWAEVQNGLVHENGTFRQFYEAIVWVWSPYMWESAPGYSSSTSSTPMIVIPPNTDQVRYNGSRWRSVKEGTTSYWGDWSLSPNVWFQDQASALRHVDNINSGRSDSSSQRYRNAKYLGQGTEYHWDGTPYPVWRTSYERSNLRTSTVYRYYPELNVSRLVPETS